MDVGGSTDMALAFELEALQSLESPGNVVEGARSWSEYVGVLSDEPTYVVMNFTRNHRIDQDFFAGAHGKADRLHTLQEQPEFQTDRYVFVGASTEDERLAEEHDWEYLDVEDAAEAAGWELSTVAPQDQTTTQTRNRDDWP